MPRDFLSRSLAPLLLAAASGLFAAACGSPEPALTVGSVTFAEDELLGLDGDRRLGLTALTALGLAFARGELDAAGEPLVERWSEDIVLERFRSWLALDRAGVEEDVLRAQYGTNPRYELEVRHVVALAEEGQPEEVHQAARATAEEALSRVRAGEAFEQVAADLSEEPGAAERGGLLQPGREGSWVDGFWRAASSLEIGEHTGVVQTEYGYHVILLEERRIVPFDEVRGRVVLDAGTMLGGGDEAWNSWSDSVEAGIQVDSSAVRAWLTSGSGSAGGSVDGSGDRELARWNGGSYSAATFGRHVVSLESDRWAQIMGSGRFESSTEAEALDEVRREALRHRALDEARAVGLELGPGAEEEVARRWRDQATSWAVQLGFAADVPVDRVKELSLAALGSSRQNATIVRRELRTRIPLLRAAYAVDEAQDP